MGTEAGASRAATPKVLEVVDDFAPSCGELIRPRELVEQVKARVAQGQLPNANDLVCLGAGAPSGRRGRRSFHGWTERDAGRRPFRHGIMHELRCFFEPAYRLHQIRMSMKSTMRRLDMGCVELFKYYDADGSGTVDKEELGMAVRTSLGLVIRQSEVDTLMDQIDKDGNICDPPSPLKRR